MFFFSFFYAPTQYDILLMYDTHINKTIPVAVNPNFIWKDHKLPNDVPGLGKTFLPVFSPQT